MSNLDAFFATVKLPTISEVGQGLMLEPQWLADHLPGADTFISVV